MQMTPQSSPPPLAPAGSAHAKKWPKIIGVIAIIYGIIGILGAINRPASAPMQKVQMNNLVKQYGADQVAVDAYLRDSLSILIMQGISMGVIAFMLLIGGIMLLKRRKVSSLIIRTWAVAYLVVASFFTLKIMPLISKQMELSIGVFKAAGGDKEAEIASRVLGLGLGLLWVLACSLFFFIWFSRLKIREEVNTWN